MSFDIFDTDAINTGGITFSGGNLIAQATAGNLNDSRIAQTLEGKTSGKWYVEFTCNAVSGNVDGVGVTSSWGLGSMGFLGDSNVFGICGIGYFTNSHVAYNGSTQSAVNDPTYTAGDVIGMAIDLDNKKIWWRKNGGAWTGTTGTPDPATNTSGFDLTPIQAQGRMYPAANLSGSGAKFTANFGASAFTGSVPSGFNSGWTNTGGVYFGTFDTNGFGAGQSTAPVGKVSVSKFTANATGVLNSVISPIRGNTGTTNIKCVIYDDTGTGGLPGALLGTSSATAAPASNVVAEVTFSGFSTVNLVSGNNYYVGFLTDAAANPANSNCPGTSAAQIWQGTGTYASPPSTFPASPTTLSFRYPILVTVTTHNTETGTGTLAFSGFSFGGVGIRETIATGKLAFSGFSFAGATSRKETGTGALAFSGFSFAGASSAAKTAQGTLAFGQWAILGYAYELGKPGGGLRQFWTH